MFTFKRFFLLFIVSFFVSCNFIYAQTSSSDNQEYRGYCLQAAQDEKTFNNFKRGQEVIAAIHNLGEYSGVEMLDHIYYHFPHLLEFFDKFRQNDLVGNPRTFIYPRAGDFSPTNLRYIKIGGEIEYFFGDLEGKTIIEIGGGYGGQCKILSDLFKFKEYILVDLPEVLALARKYLERVGVENVTYLTMEQLPQNRTYDLVISNFALSECSRKVQKTYLNQVLAVSLGGFIYCNQMRWMPDTAPFRPREMIEEIKKIGRKPKLYEEMPLTARDNYLVVWKES